MSTKKRGLGKGLSALLENAETDITSKNLGKAPKVVGSVADIPIANIEANPFQPRTHFEEEALQELSASIKEHGIIQPLTVRKMGHDTFQLISGERRFRASQLAGLKEVPAYIRIANDQAMLEMALVENIQRQDLDAIEVALSYQRLIDEINLTQEQLSERVGKKRSTITNYLRLLKLPAEIQAGIRARQLSMGHARALVGAGDEAQQLKLYRQIIEEGLSVRAAEGMAKESAKSKKATKKTDRVALAARHNSFKRSFSHRIDAKVDVHRTDSGKGKITISFSTDEDLDRLMDLLGG